MPTNSTTIKFYLGEESRLVIEDFSTKDKSIFKDSYNTALSIVLDYIRNSKKQKNSAIEFFRQTADVIDNNIIAFIGERGSGKSSCMLSVANMLKKISTTDTIGTDINAHCGRGFEVLETIDPSFFEEKTNVLEIVLGRMFSNFRKKCDKGNDDETDDYEKIKTELFKAFQMVKESLVNTNGCQISEDDCVDGLLKLTASVDLRDSFKKLIEKYLDFLKKDYLIISIDDLDLSTKHAYKMAEQIRKYLRQEKVIVLLALKLEQLEYAVQLQYETQYKEIKEKDPLNIPEMVSKYILKLIPDNNRIYLPNIQLWANATINVYKEANTNKEISDKSIDCESNGKKWILLNKLPIKDDNGNDVYEKNKSNQTLKYYIVSLIFKKTRYLFYHTTSGISPIVPRNLREMRFLIELLENMEDYSTCKNENNKLLFKEYFVTTWIANYIPQSKQPFLKKLYSINKPEMTNKFILDGINNIYHEKVDSLILENDEIKNIYNKNNKAYNISLGDVLCIIDNLKNSSANIDDIRFFFAIETFYSMRLYEYYDLIPMEENNIKEDSNKKNDSNISDRVKKKSILEPYNSYTKLVGCNLLNQRIRSINSSSNLFFTINIRNLVILWKEIVEKIKKGEDPLLNLQIIEFFTLCLSTKGKIDFNYRNQDEVSFDSEFTISQQYATFDIMALFANLPRIEKQYKRISIYLNNMVQNNEINSNFIELVKKTDNSLYNQIKDYCKKNRKYSENKYMSWVTIRNVEILDDFIQFLKQIWINPEWKLYDSLKKIISKISDEYEIFTYDYDEKNFYTITFSFFKILKEFFEKEEIENIINEIGSESLSTETGDKESDETDELKNKLNEIAKKILRKQALSGLYQLFLDNNPQFKNNGFSNYWNSIKSNISIPQNLNEATKLYLDIVNGFTSQNK